MDVPHQETRNTRRPWCVIAWVAGLACTAVGAAASPASTGMVQVTAVVKRHAAIRIAAPQVLVISQGDLDRGYVEVAAPMQLTVRSNVPEGYTIALQNQGEQVSQATVHGLAAPLVVAAGGGSLSRPAPQRGLWTDTLELRVRFQLSPGARAGTHAWPLTVSIMGM